MNKTRVNLRENRTPQFQVFSDDQKKTIFNGMIRTLQGTGANVHHEEARELLSSHGCRVEGIRVFIPPQVVLKALSSLPPVTEIFCWDGDQEKKIVVEQGR